MPIPRSGAAVVRIASTFATRLEVAHRFVPTCLRESIHPSPFDEPAHVLRPPHGCARRRKGCAIVRSPSRRARGIAGAGLTNGAYQARDAASAIRAFSDAADPADAVLLDLHLPDADDFRVLTAIRAMSPATPVIVMTAQGYPELHDEARTFGAFMVLDKPFEMDRIAPLVRRALTGRCPSPQSEPAG